MNKHEALLLKCWDSDRSTGAGATKKKCRFTAHTAFLNPNAPIDAPPRESLDCGIGFFAENNGATFCAPCLPGFYDAGDSNRDKCKSCPKGYYQDKSGKDATQCYEW